MHSIQHLNHPFLPQTESQIKTMLKTMNISSIENLYSGIPKELRFEGELNLPQTHSEQETLRKIQSVLQKNLTTDSLISFLGAGVYSHFIPSVVPSIVNRSEFITSYTPYAPEVSQGMLQGLWEYQSMIAELTKLDLVNSSMYDFATALGEAALMATRATKKGVLLIPEYIQPERFSTLVTYTTGPNVKIETYPCDKQSGQVEIEKLVNIIELNKNQISGIYIENPNFWGVIEEEIVQVGEIAHEENSLFIIGFDPISLGLLKSPGELGADIAIGDGQSLGLPMNFGGPLLGLFAVKNDRKLVRSMPGRIIGLTTEQNSTERAFTMTLQTREQHIRRERATSNICTNNALCALASTVYLSLIGPNGLKTLAETSIAKAHLLAERLSNFCEISSPHFTGPFFKEFVFTLNSPSLMNEFTDFMRMRNILPGFSLIKDFPSLGASYLTSVTEMTMSNDIKLFLDSVDDFFSTHGGK
ncbi:MAG: aminomethyl-transferring glycine dehydrogenase subunit GcvPA [Candidatus Hodarchaeales archaeon]|jgi:glycine dehydrogenase subunit 1